MAKPQKLSSVFWRTIRFVAAGSGIGSLVGTALGPWLYPQLSEGLGTLDEQELARYGGTFFGIWVGLAVGATAGVIHAVMVRRSRLR